MTTELPTPTFRIGNINRSRKSFSAGLNEAIDRLSIDASLLAACVAQASAEFSEGGGDLAALGGDDEVSCYCAQGVVAAVALSVGGYEEHAANSPRDFQMPHVQALLETSILASLSHVGFVSDDDEPPVREFKRLVFSQAWGFCQEDEMLSCTPLMQKTVERLVLSGR